MDPFNGTPDDKETRTVCMKKPEVPPYAVEFCTADGSGYIFAIADEDGFVSVFSSAHSPSKSGPLRPLYRLQAHNNAIFDIAWLPGENILATASGDKTAVVWDMIKGVAVTTFKGHSCSLRAVSVSKHDKDRLVTGSRDGNVLLWDRRCSQPVLRIQDAHVVSDDSTPRRKRRTARACQTQLMNDSQQTVSCALFQDSNTIITAGTRDGAVKLWDVRSMNQAKKSSAKKCFQPVETLPYPGSSLRRRGYTSLTLDSSSSHLYASCTDDSIYHYNLANLSTDGRRQPICRYSGLISSSFYLRTALSGNDQFLLSGSCDNKAYIWNADGKCEVPIVHLSSDVMSEVTAVAWCPKDITHLVTCSDDCVVRVWRTAIGKHPGRSEVDGAAEAVEKDVLGCKCGCDFSPISAPSRLPTPRLSSFESQLFTPTKPPKENESALQTLSKKLAQTPIGSLFTPTRTTVIRTPSATPTTPLGNYYGNIKTPTSIEKWLVKAGEGQKERKPGSKASKSLTMQMNNCERDNKENLCTKTGESNSTPSKNWLVELSKKRKNENGGSASKRKKRSLSSPMSTATDGTTPRRQAKSISSYFQDLR